MRSITILTILFLAVSSASYAQIGFTLEDLEGTTASVDVPSNEESLEEIEAATEENNAERERLTEAISGSWTPFESWFGDEMIELKEKRKYYNEVSSEFTYFRFTSDGDIVGIYYNPKSKKSKSGEMKIREGHWKLNSENNLEIYVSGHSYKRGNFTYRIEYEIESAADTSIKLKTVKIYQKMESER